MEVVAFFEGHGGGSSKSDVTFGLTFGVGQLLSSSHFQFIFPQKYNFNIRTVNIDSGVSILSRILDLSRGFDLGDLWKMSGKCFWTSFVESPRMFHRAVYFLNFCKKVGRGSYPRWFWFGNL